MLLYVDVDSSSNFPFGKSMQIMHACSVHADYTNFLSVICVDRK